MNYFYLNIVGLPKQLTDRQGNNLWQADYEIWGNNKEE
ncbi:RHS domain-containing protein [Gilliamella sp. wkB112]